MAKGDRVCTVCGAFIGNYLDGDYYRLIRAKYCDKCKEFIRQSQKTTWQHNDRVSCRQQVRELQEQLDELRKENEMLRGLLRDKRNTDSSGTL